MEISNYTTSSARLRLLGHLTLAPISAVQGTAVPTGDFSGPVTTSAQMDDVQVPPRGQPL